MNDIGDNMINIITTASANNLLIDSITTITKNEFKMYLVTVMVENTEKLNKFINELNNYKFIKRVERQIN